MAISGTVSIQPKTDCDGEIKVAPAANIGGTEVKIIETKPADTKKIEADAKK